MSARRMFLRHVLFVGAILSCFPAAAEEITVYSARGKALTRRAFNKFTFATGIEVKVVNGDTDELLTKLEKETPRADILLAVDAGSLWKAKQSGLFQQVNSDVLSANIPNNLRDPNGYWFGLSKRVRTIVFSTQRVSESELSTYADLADPKWKGRLCLRTSTKVYNRSLVAMMIAKHGPERAQQIVKGWVNNLATQPFPKDNDVITAIDEGRCDVGIVNHYYYGIMLKADPNRKVGIFWANQNENEGGVYVDVSGAGVLKKSENIGAAIQFLEWFSSDKAQNFFTDTNLEYPVNPNVKPDPQIQQWGDFVENGDNLNLAGEYRDAAIKLMAEAGYL